MSKTYLCTSNKAGFLTTRSITPIDAGLSLSYVNLLLSSWKTYTHVCAIWRYGISTNNGDSYGHKLRSTHSGFLFYLLQGDFMSYLHKSKHCDLIDMSKDTSRYLDDTRTFSIDKPEFEKHIPDIYQAELQLNKADSSDKEPSFLD